MDWFTANQTPFHLFLLQRAFNLCVSLNAVPFAFSVCPQVDPCGTGAPYTHCTAIAPPECADGVLQYCQEKPGEPREWSHLLRVKYVDSWSEPFWSWIRSFSPFMIAHLIGYVGLIIQLHYMLAFMWWSTQACVCLKLPSGLFPMLETLPLATPLPLSMCCASTRG